jgi:hypothetical protein
VPTPGFPRPCWRAAGQLVIAEGWLASADYEIRCQPGGRFAELKMYITNARGQRTLVLTATPDGSWRANGQPRPDLTGCIDIDINSTPLTNTLPIRRLGWAPGQARDFVMAHVSVPELTVRSVQQRYTCLTTGAAGTDRDASPGEASALFRYETAPFRADLLVDDNGLVVDYPDF